MSFKEYLRNLDLSRQQVFSFYKTSLLSKRAFIMLLFQVIPFNNDFKKQYFKIINLACNNTINCYKVVFTNNNKIMIDNKLDNNYYLLNFKELINNYFIINNNYFKKLNFNKPCIVKVDKQKDNTYYKVFVFSKSSLKDLQAILNYSSFKYKFNLNKQERKLVYKLKNNYLKGNKYSYNFFYMLDIQDNIKELEKQELDLKQELLALDNQFKLLKQELLNIKSLGYKTNNYKFKINLANSYKQVLKELETIQESIYKNTFKLKELEKQELDLKELESNLTSSKDKETCLNDYLDKFKYIE